MPAEGVRVGLIHGWGSAGGVPRRALDSFKDEDGKPIVDVVVFGHTHQPKCEQVGPITLYNGGFWSKAFADPECTIPLGEQTFVWIRPGNDLEGRTAELCEWKATEDTPSE